MQLSTVLSNVTEEVSSELLNAQNLDYCVIDYTKFDGSVEASDVIDESKEWSLGCVVAPCSTPGYFVSVNVFQNERHYPAMLVRVHGNLNDAVKAYEICARYIESQTLH